MRGRCSDIGINHDADNIIYIGVLTLQPIERKLNNANIKLGPQPPVWCHVVFVYQNAIPAK